MVEGWSDGKLDSEGMIRGARDQNKLFDITVDLVRRRVRVPTRSCRYRGIGAVHR
jgi:hypothetical protein